MKNTKKTKSKPTATEKQPRTCQQAVAQENCGMSCSSPIEDPTEREVSIRVQKRLSEIEERQPAIVKKAQEIEECNSQLRAQIHQTAYHRNEGTRSELIAEQLRTRRAQLLHEAHLLANG